MVSLYSHLLIKHSYKTLGLVSPTRTELHVQNVKHVKKKTQPYHPSENTSNALHLLQLC